MKIFIRLFGIVLIGLIKLVRELEFPNHPLAGHQDSPPLAGKNLPRSGISTTIPARTRRFFNSPFSLTSPMVPAGTLL